ncbi:F-box only protein 47, partial [Ophiophagus hannah]
LLFKRCTLLLPTKERLKYTHKILSEISCFKFNGCSDPLHCFGLQCYGVFLETLTAGWDEYECHRVYNFLCEVTNLPQKMQKVVNSKPGHVAWQNMIQDEADENSLKELADAVKLLHDTEANEWLENDVNLIDELAVMPQEWHLENTARFLILCGNNICLSFMASKAVNGQTMELARLVVFLALVCEKDIYCMDWAVKIMQKVCNILNTTHEKNIFLQNIENAFAQKIMDALQFVTSGENDEEETRFLNLFHLVNAQASFHKEILYLTMNYNVSTMVNKHPEMLKKDDF